LIKRPNRLTSAAMIALLCFFLTLFASPFKSKSRLEAENAVLRRHLIILRRKVRGRAGSADTIACSRAERDPVVCLPMASRLKSWRGAMSDV
jgi:hypothetical protein